MFTHPLHKDSSLESLYGQYEQKAKVTVGFNKENCSLIEKDHLGDLSPEKDCC